MANIITVLVEHDNINYYKDKLNDIDREIVLKALGEDIVTMYIQYDNNAINVQPNMSDISNTSDSYILGFERPNELVEIAEEWNLELRDNAVRHLEELEALAKLDISSFDTSHVTDMGAMFTYCSKLTQLDLALFDTRNVTDTRWMFEHCEKLTTIFISNKWSMDMVTNSMNMFKECCSLPSFSPEKIGIEMAKPTEQGGYLILKK